MDQTAARATAPQPIVFSDGFGNRRRLSLGGETIEVLCLRPELTAVSSFEAALRERTGRLAGFAHPSFGRIRSIQRPSEGQTIVVVSSAVPGTRLSELLAGARRNDVFLDLDAALCVVRQLVHAITALHEQGEQVWHGSVGLGHLVVTPDARLMVLEHVLGSALQQLRYSQARYWKELRIPTRQSTEVPELDHRADLLQIGVVALELILGRPLTDDEWPSGVGAALASACAVSPRGDHKPLPAPLRAWLASALQLDLREAFTSGTQAQAALEAVVGDGSSTGLENFLARYEGSAAAPTAASAPSERPASLVSAPPPVADTPQPMLETSETTIEEPSSANGEVVEPPRPHRVGWRRAAVAAVALVCLAGGGSLVARQRRPAKGPETGKVAIDTNPAGVTIVIDGQTRGVTPAALTLTAGAHILELSGPAESRTLPLMVTAGAQMSQYIKLSNAPQLATGSLETRTDPAGAKVSVDAVTRRESPVTVTDRSPGERPVGLSGAGEKTQQAVRIDPTPPGPVSGWITVSGPYPVQLFENGRLLGSGSDPLMVPAGTHRLDIVNDVLGYHGSRTVKVVAGKESPIEVDLPKGTIALNAVPWAEVWIDGEQIGDTPLGNLSITLGPHDIVFRHPNLGEQHRAVTVTLTAPVRISVDMRRQ